MTITFVATPDTLTLSNPTLGNSELLNTQFQFKKAMSGKVYSYKKGQSLQKLILHFFNLSSAEATALRAFVEDHAGDDVTYTDWNSVAWIGHITSDPIEISTDGPDNSHDLYTSDCTIEHYSAVVEFEGELV